MKGPKLHRKFDGWYDLFGEIAKERPGLSDHSIACWTKDGGKFSRGELLKLLRSGAASWNKWRRSLPDLQWYRVKGDFFWLPGFLLRLPNCDFRNYDFSGYELVSTDFSNSSFVRSSFNSVDFGWLAGRPFQSQAKLIGCNFRSATFAGTRFGYAPAANSDFSRAELNGAQVNKADFSGAKFSNAMVAVKFDDTDLSGANFDSSHIMGASFTNVDLSKAIGESCSLLSASYDRRSFAD